MTTRLNKRERRAQQLLAHYATMERLAALLADGHAKCDVCGWNKSAHQSGTLRCPGVPDFHDTTFAFGDGKKISVALFHLENTAHAVATALCNGENIRIHRFGSKPFAQIPEDFDANSETASDRLQSRCEDALRNLFGKLPPGFFVNGDARGYALKIDNNTPEGKALIEAVGMHRDFGGFGILSPEITGD